MPIYTFKDKTTEEEFTMELTMAEREEFLLSNPNIIQLLNTINIVDAVRIGVKKPPSDFMKYVVGKAKAAPGAHNPAIEKRHHIPKEI